MTESLGAPHQWLTFFYAFAPHFKDALRECFWDALFGPTALYNQNLWTLSVEFAGSFLVYGFLALAGNLRRRGLCYFVVGAVLVLTNHVLLLDFLAGMMLCDLYAANQARRRLALPWPAAACWRRPGWASITSNYVGRFSWGWRTWSPALLRGRRRRPAAGRRGLFAGAATATAEPAVAVPGQDLFRPVPRSPRRHLFAGQRALFAASPGLRPAPQPGGGDRLAGVRRASMTQAWFMSLYVDRPAVAVGRYVYEHVFKKSCQPGRRDGAAEQPRGTGLPSAA